MYEIPQNEIMAIPILIEATNLTHMSFICSSPVELKC
jgi:hypothetical protein